MDISRQDNDKPSDNAVRASEPYLSTIMDIMQDGLIVVSEAEIVVDANQAFYKMTGYTKADLGMLTLDLLFQRESNQFRQDRRESLLQNSTVLFETQIIKKDGCISDVEISAALLNPTPLTTICFIRDITDRKNAAQSILQSHDLMRYIIEHSRNSVAVHDKNMNYMYLSRPYADIFRVNASEIIGKNHYEVFPDLPQKTRSVHKRVLQGEVVCQNEDQFVFKDGSMEWMRWECRPWYENDGEIGGLVIYSENITERKQMQQLLFNEKEHFKTTLLSVGEGIISTDNNGVITVMNPIAEKLTGWTSQDALGKPLDDVFKVIREDTGKQNESYLKKIIKTGTIIELSNNILMVSKSGQEIPIEVCAAPIKDSGVHVVGVVIVIRDFTEKRSKQKQIEYLSYYDAITGLYNRRYMEDSIRKLDTRKNFPLALMVIDVNGLKLTNDAFGHEMGDQLLIKVADLIKKVCRADDIVGRMGGDEYCMLLPHTDEIQAELIKERIKESAAHLKLEPIIVSLAVGFAVKRSPNQDIKAVMTTADNLMYKDKIKYGRAMKSHTIDMIIHNININYAQEQVHTERVSQFCETIAKAMNFSERDVKDIKTAGALHDIGKIMVPPHLLNKTGKLTHEEFELIKRHSEIGYQMLKSVDEYTHLSEIVLYHHERYDGTGYPEGLTGESIPLYSRIIAVADAFEAMTALRPYQKTKTKEAAVAELIRCAGVQFDPEIVTVFIEKVL